MIPKVFGQDYEEVNKTQVMILGHSWSFHSEDNECQKQPPRYMIKLK